MSGPEPILRFLVVAGGERIDLGAHFSEGFHSPGFLG